MLKNPNIPDAAIRTCLHDAFGLHIAQITFLPIGWVNNAVYQLTADNGAQYFQQGCGGRSSLSSWARDSAGDDAHCHANPDLMGS